jgi:hypothetical protein
MALPSVDISHVSDLNAICKGFAIERPISRTEILRWDLRVVLSINLNLWEKVQLLIQHVTLPFSLHLPWEVWVFSADMCFEWNTSNVTLSFLLAFIAQIQKLDDPESALSPVAIPALACSMGPDLFDRTYCPVRALLFYSDRASIRTNSDSLKKL